MNSWWLVNYADNDYFKRKNEERKAQKNKGKPVKRGNSAPVPKSQGFVSGADMWHKLNYESDFVEQNIKDADIRGGMWHSLNNQKQTPASLWWAKYTGIGEPGGKPRVKPDYPNQNKNDYWFDAVYNPDGTFNYKETNPKLEAIIARKEAKLANEGKKVEHKKPKRSAIDRIFGLIASPLYGTAGAIYEATNKDFKVNKDTLAGKYASKNGKTSGNVSKVLKALQGLETGLKSGNPFGEVNKEDRRTTEDLLDNAGWRKIKRNEVAPYQNKNLNKIRMARKAMAGLFDVGNYAIKQKARGKDFEWDEAVKPRKSNPLHIEPANLDRMGVSFLGDVVLDPTNYVSLGVNAFRQGTGTKYGKKTVDRLSRGEASDILKSFGEEANSKNVNEIIRRVDDLQGVKKGGRGLTVGFGNLPFIGDTKFGQKYTKTFADADDIRKFSDKIGYASNRNYIIRNISKSKLGKLFNNNAGLKELARKNPYEAGQIIKAYDMLHGRNKEFIQSNLDTIKYVNNRLKDLSPEDQSNIIHLLEHPNDFVRRKHELELYQTKYGEEFTDRIAKYLSKAEEFEKLNGDRLDEFVNAVAESRLNSLHGEAIEVDKVYSAKRELDNAIRSYKEGKVIDKVEIEKLRNQYNELKEAAESSIKPFTAEDIIEQLDDMWDGLNPQQKGWVSRRKKAQQGLQASQYLDERFNTEFSEASLRDKKKKEDNAVQNILDILDDALTKKETKANIRKKLYSPEGFINEIHDNIGKFKDIDADKVMSMEKYDKAKLLNEMLFNGMPVVPSDVYTKPLDEAVKMAINGDEKGLVEWTNKNKHLLDSRSNEIYSHLADKFNYTTYKTDIGDKIDKLIYKKNKGTITESELEKLDELVNISRDRKALRDKLFKMDDASYKDYFTNLSNKKLYKDSRDVLDYDLAYKRNNFIADKADEINKLKIDTPSNASEIKDDIANRFFGTSYNDIVNNPSTVNNARRKFIEGEFQRHVYKQNGSNYRLKQNFKEGVEEFFSNLDDDDANRLYNYADKHGIDLGKMNNKKLNEMLELAKTEVGATKDVTHNAKSLSDTTPSLKEAFDLSNKPKVDLSYNIHDVNKKYKNIPAIRDFEEFKRELGIPEGGTFDDIIDDLSWDSVAEKTIKDLQKNYDDILLKFKSLPDTVVSRQTKIDVLQGKIPVQSIPVSVRRNLSQYIDNNLVKVSASGKFYDPITGELLEKIPNADSNITRLFHTLSNSNKVDKIIGKYYKASPDELAIEVTESMVKALQGLESSNKAYNKLQLYYEAARNKNVFDALMQDEYAIDALRKAKMVVDDVYVNGKKVDEEIVEIADELRKYFKDMWDEELINGLVDKDGEIAGYVPHILTDEGKKFMAKRKKEQLKGVPKETIEELSNKGHQVTDMFGFGKKYNPHRKEREWNFPLEKMNEYMKQEFGVDGFLETDLSKLYLARSLKHNEVMYDAKTNKKFVEIFGSRIKDLSDLKAGHKPVVTFNDLKRATNHMDDKTKKKLFNKLGLETDVLEGYVTPVIELTDEQLRLVNKHFGHVPVMGLNKVMIDDINKIAIKQQHANKSLLLKLHDKALQLYKINVTATIPGFHSRNKFGNMFQNYLDIGTEAVNPKNQKQAIDIIVGKQGFIKTRTGKKISYEEIRQNMNVDGILDSGYFSSDLNSVFKKNKLFDMKGANANPLDAKNFVGYKAGSNIGGLIENQDKVVNYVANLKLDKSFRESAEHVNKFLFDYSDLTGFEQNVMKRIFPFYTWMRKNTPLQFEMLFEKPEIYKGIAKSKTFLEKQVPKEDRVDKQYIADFAQDWIQIPGKVKNPEGREEPLLWNPNLPYGDMANIPSFTDGKGLAKEAITMMNPFIKVPIELQRNENIFFENEIEKYPGQLVDMPGYLDPIGNIKGEPKQMSPKVKHVLNQIASLQAMGKFAEKKGFDRAVHGINTLGGVKVVSYDYDKYKHYQLRDRLNDIQKVDDYEQWKYYAMKRKLKELERIEQEKKRRGARR